MSPQQLFAWRRAARLPLEEMPAREPLFVPAVIAAPELEPSEKRARSTRKRKAARDAGAIELEIDGRCDAGRPWRRCQDGGGGDPRAEGCDVIGRRVRSR
ncbi:hypothetical protein [Mesorhizobium sp. CN2-181]|uniref:hypothetical protein n=1 Tax=Mesorhizobium yinganensis TaxID=3157707 RepID=UPI0032B7B75C